MTGLIPMFLKTAYKKEPVFSNSKVVFTIGENTFTENLGKEFIKQAVISNLIKEKDLDPYKTADNTAMFNGGATYADAISFGDGQIQKKLADSFSKVKGKKVIPYQQDSDLTEYLQLYNDLANK
jgi:starch synthase